MSDVEWYAVREQDSCGYDVRAWRDIGHGTIAMGRWRVSHEQLSDAHVSRWLTASMLVCQRRLDAALLEMDAPPGCCCTKCNPNGVRLDADSYEMRVGWFK